MDSAKCKSYSGQVQFVSCIESPDVIEKMPQPLALKESPPLPRTNEARGLPDQTALFQRYMTTTTAIGIPKSCIASLFTK